MHVFDRKNDQAAIHMRVAAGFTSTVTELFHVAVDFAAATSSSAPRPVFISVVSTSSPTADQLRLGFAVDSFVFAAIDIDSA
jgi:hypothetical protein